MVQKRNYRSAGIGDPYWYEWGIGLLKAVEMLNPDSGIEAVAFQKDGVKGWDDVVIRFSSGHSDYYQVKHSRPGSNLTFSDLVAKQDNKSSLLGSISSAWHDMGLSGTDSSCILITNRRAGTKRGRSKNGISHPPLAKFIEHISAQLETTPSIGDVCVPDDWQDAWDLWQTEMGAISADEKLRFLRALTISTDAPQLEEMQDKLAQSLGSILGITTYQAEPLIKNLLSALMRWTTSLRGENEWVNAEDVMDSLTESIPDIFGDCDVPTPVPFFPSRDTAVDNITGLLAGDGEFRVVFLEAEPGAGKTSVVSRIVNQRAEDSSTLIIDLRYYAFRPITPDAPLLPIDTDRSASAESLWFSLLNQLRKRLRGRLLEFRIPVRNHFITPDDARDHVLRISSILAEEKHSPFVIVIDGIDHAARAARMGLPSLLASLPGPESIPEGVRLLIVGQSASAYPEYPNWLRIQHEMVERIGLGEISIQDIRLLLARSATRIPLESLNHASRMITDTTGGNTLAAVFSVAEAESCNNLKELEERLADRQLHSGVHTYYQLIWDSAINDSNSGVSAYLAFVLCILRQRTTANILHEAFPAWKKPKPEWEGILRSLEPLVVRDDDGFRVRHNDIRVFLERELRKDGAILQQIASLLADYYMGPSADPIFRHESVFTLLQLAGRTTEKARIFNPSWVLNAAAYGRNISIIIEEAEEAFRVLPDLKEWDTALAVACGGMTLLKLSECIDAHPDLLKRLDIHQAPLPSCFETERFVLPFSRWDDSTIRQVLSNSRMLDEANQIERARGLIDNWLSTVTPSEVVAGVSGIVVNRDFGNGQNLAKGVGSLFKDWGALAFRLEIETDRGDPLDSLEHEATSLFEKGWVAECFKLSEEDRIYSILETFCPKYLSTFEIALENASNRGMWEVVKELLDKLFDKKDTLHLDFRVRAAYWALKTIGEDAAKDWLEILSEARTGIIAKNRIEMPLMIYVAKAIGWIEPHREASSIATELTDALTSQGQYGRDRRSLLLPLCAAAMVGINERMFAKGDLKGAAILNPSTTVVNLIQLIWENKRSIDSYMFRGLALNLTFELIEQCQKIGDKHTESVLSLSQLVAEGFPVDQRMPVLWEVLRRAGRRDLLHSWAEHWIGEQGVVWSGIDYSERIEIVENLLRLTRKEGWYEMAAKAEGRLHHRIIGYSSHKDYSFWEPLEWLEELTRSEPSAWSKEGLQLLDICRECRDQDGDNRFSSEIENEVTAASFRCGPQGAWSFFNCIDPDIERYWIQTVRINLIAASKRVISDRMVADQVDILALWSCAVGLSRWFDRNQAQVLTELRDIIMKAVASKDRDEIMKRMHQLTPGEVLREEHEEEPQKSEFSLESDEKGTDLVDVEDMVSEIIMKVDRGYEPTLMEIGRIAENVVRENPIERAELMTNLFELIGANRKYIKSWDYWGQPHPLRSLISVIREDETWALMQVAVHPTSEAYWLRSVPRNIHLICLFRAVCEGIDTMKKGAEQVFAMHRIWSGLPDKTSSNARELQNNDTVDTWPAFVARVLHRVLNADSAESVSSALRGLDATVSLVPDVMSILFDGCNKKQRSRLMLGMEVWAARYPDVALPILTTSWNHREHLELHDRIQLWICMLAYYRSNNRTFTESFLPKQSGGARDFQPSLILTRPRKLLEISSEVEGSIRLANTYSAARNYISRFGRITGRDTEDLESTITEDIIVRKQDLESGTSREVRDHFATEDGDLIINNNIDSILENALEYELQKNVWSNNDAGDLAISVTHGDDPWIIRQSPLPSPRSFDWPEQTEVNEWLSKETDEGNVLNRLKLLVNGDDLKEKHTVLGSYLRLFTSTHDCEMWYWLEEVNSEIIMKRKVPHCPSGRCFQLYLSDRFEPSVVKRTALVSFSGSIICLPFSTLEVVPARMFQDHFGWEPMPENPLVWRKDSRIVAKYEIFHGPLDYNWSRRHMRQPTLSRWVVSTDALADMEHLTPQCVHEISSYSGD